MSSSALINWVTRKIGDTNVPALGYGAMSIGGMAFGTPGDDESRLKLLDRLLQLGETFWDTARIYGDSEDLIGKWFAADPTRRDKIFLATKFGLDENAGYAVRGDPEFIRLQLATSLKKLNTDHIDLYYQHRPDTKTPIEVTIKALAELVKEGKIKYIGLSDATPNTIRRAHKIHPISAIQIEFSPFEREALAPGGVIETARELGISIVAYSPTGRGLTTGRYKSPADFDKGDLRLEIPRYSADNFPYLLNVTSVLATVGEAHNATAGQVAIAWMLTQGDDIIPIPGSKTLKYAEENIRAVEVILTTEEVKKIQNAVDEADKVLSKHPSSTAYGVAIAFQETPPYEG